MHIALKKFGTTLISRPAGKEAFLAIQTSLKEIQKSENLEVDFADILVLAPGWADEFITPISQRFKGKLILLNTENPSVKASLSTLKKARS